MKERELLVISGMSGAGKSSVANALEDAGWYVVDNLPPALISSLFAMTEQTVRAIAVVIDVRGRERDARTSGAAEVASVHSVSGVDGFVKELSVLSDTELAV